MEGLYHDRASHPHPRFFCRLTNAVMVDPVRAPDGFVYERNAIEAYLEKNGTSPIITDFEMKVDELKPDDMSRSEIELYKLPHEFVNVSELPPEQLVLVENQAKKNQEMLKKAFDSQVPATSTLFMIAGSILWPGFGIFIGHVVGDVIGSWLGQPLVSYVIDKMCPGYLAKTMEEKDYKRALDAFHLTENSSYDQVMSTYREQMLANHPDKVGDDKEAAERLVHAMTNFDTIKKYRQQRNAWDPEHPDTA
eukprot:TRINITY_DN3357_c0_g2_i1.p1 TRINITY_DN3357_c0_g2~~TRINITY_DN3357_c0_g2_i1.p1  ORF type:complete len:250 (+),score=37.35 TRINITY_DN3357_c0_g2_i1:55-804(+)